MTTESIIARLASLNGFKITSTLHGGLLIEAEGVKYDGSCMVVAEALEEAYLMISAKRWAKQMVKDAKVVLDEN